MLCDIAQVATLSVLCVYLSFKLWPEAIAWNKFKNDNMFVTYKSMNYIRWLLLLPSAGILLYVTLNDFHTIIKEYFYLSKSIHNDFY